MKYDMTAEVREIAKITGKTESQIADELKISWTDDCEAFACNRREQGSVLYALDKAKEVAQKAATIDRAITTKGNGVWRRVGEKWMVQTSIDVQVGDMLVVSKKNGETSDVVVKSILTKNNCAFCEVSNADTRKSESSENIRLALPADRGFSGRPQSGEIIVENGIVYKVVSSYYHDSDGWSFGAMCDEWYDVKAIDITQTSQGAKILEEKSDIEAEKSGERRNRQDRSHGGSDHG